MTRTLFFLTFAMFAGAAMAQETDISSAATAARQVIEREGYRDVRGLAEDTQGVWHGRALRGNTEVQLLVDEDGNVAINR